VSASGLPLTTRRATRNRSTACATAIALTFVLAGCSNPAIDKAAGRGAGAGITVRPSAEGLTIENHTTRPLLNVRVTVTAAGADTPFVRVVPAIEAEQNTDLRVADLLSESGAVLDAGVNAPQSALVAARDTLGNSYSGATRW
jgi:hypothetical protein